MAFLHNAFGLSHIGYVFLWKAKSFTDANKGATSEGFLYISKEHQLKVAAEIKM